MSLTALDRLRIERTVWTVDTYVTSLPGTSRRAVRRELRANLRESAASLGAVDAIRGLGSLRRLALEYLDAEYGEGRPRPRILKGLFWAFAVEAVVVGWLILGLDSFSAGIAAADAGAGVYGWDGARWLGGSADVTYDGTTPTGFAWSLTPLVLAYPMVAFVLESRLWRAFPVWRRRSRLNRAQRPSAAGI
jgi:hypothetical protein